MRLEDEDKSSKAENCDLKFEEMPQSNGEMVKMGEDAEVEDKSSEAKTFDLQFEEMLCSGEIMFVSISCDLATLFLSFACQNFALSFVCFSLLCKAVRSLSSHKSPAFMFLSVILCHFLSYKR